MKSLRDVIEHIKDKKFTGKAVYATPELFLDCVEQAVKQWILENLPEWKDDTLVHLPIDKIKCAIFNDCLKQVKERLGLDDVPTT